MMRDISRIHFFSADRSFYRPLCRRRKVSNKNNKENKENKENLLSEKKYFAKSRKRRTAIIKLTTKHPFISSFFFFFFFHAYIGQRW